MLKGNNKKLAELDQTLEELKQLVQWERIQNEAINHRIIEKELFLKKLEQDQSEESVDEIF